jgi:hypothetical protein
VCSQFLYLHVPLNMLNSWGFPQELSLGQGNNMFKQDNNHKQDMPLAKWGCRVPAKMTYVLQSH